MSGVAQEDALDTFHAVVLFVGLVVLFDHTVHQQWDILFGLGALLLWTLGYWSVVKFALPPAWSGQGSTAGASVGCLLGHDWEEQTVEQASAYRHGTLFTGLKHVEYECDRCDKKLTSLMTPGQLTRAREAGAPPRT